MIMKDMILKMTDIYKTEEKLQKTATQRSGIHEHSAMTGDDASPLDS